MSESTKLTVHQQRFVGLRKVLAGESMKSQLTNALPRHINPETMIRAIMTAVNSSPKLLECDQPSFLQAVMEMSSLGLMPGPLGHAYLVPYGKKVTFIAGYKGLLELARRSGDVASIQARLVYENDDFDFDYAESNPLKKHVPAQMRKKEPGDFLCAYMIARLKSGEAVFELMWSDQIEAIRKRSPASRQGPWVTDLDEMRRKSVVRRGFKYLPCSVEAQQAVAIDEQLDLGIPVDVPAQVVEDDGDGEEQGTLDKMTEDIKKNGAKKRGRRPAQEVEPAPADDPETASSERGETDFLDAVDALRERATAALAPFHEDPGAFFTSFLETILEAKFQQAEPNILTLETGRRKALILALTVQVEAWEEEFRENSEPGLPLE